MSIYIVNLGLILALAWPLCIHKPTQLKKLLYLAITFGALFFLAAARQGIGNDYDSYIEIYQQAAQTPWSALRTMPYETGYVVLCRLLGALSLGIPAMYAVMAALCLVPVAWFIYRYSPNIWLSVWLYVTLTFFYGTMNFVRQNLAVAILLLGYPLLRKKKLWAALCYAAVILAACLFHQTALIMLPVLLVCYIPLKKPLLGAYGVLALALYLCSDWVLNFITNYIFTQYKDTYYIEIGLEYYFLIIPALVLVLVIVLQKKLEQRYPDANLILNLVLYGALIWLFITKHLLLERFSLYFYIYVLLAVPMACACLTPDAGLQKECGSINARCAELKKQNNGSKSSKCKALLRQSQEISEKYLMQNLTYWSLIVLVLIVTLVYHVFGMTDGVSGFHGVFPYHSYFKWINRLP